MYSGMWVAAPEGWWVSKLRLWSMPMAELMIFYLKLKMDLDRSVYGDRPKVVSSTKIVSMSARLDISFAVSRQLDFLLGCWAWDLVHHPELPRHVISSDRLAACAMGVSWWCRIAFSCSLAVAISAWSASDSKFDSLVRAADGVDLVRPVIIRAPAQCCASSFMRLLSDNAGIQEDAQ